MMCDAGNETTIRSLRERKQRPRKPLALLYPNINLAEADVELCNEEKNMLQNIKAPIVLCHLRKNSRSTLPVHLLAPGLNRMGVMLPYAPLLQLIATAFGKPLVATSGNISGCPITFTNEEALTELSQIADYLLLHNRDIVTPQDDSVIQFSAMHKLPILLRRSRGYAPGYYPSNLPTARESLLAMGSEMKGSFGIVHRQKCFISQYLGDQGYYDAQQSYHHSLQHLSGLLQFVPDVILADSHPGYEVSKYGRALAIQHDIPFVAIPHHEAHFAAVLAENNLLKSTSAVLGITWDGTGYGNDGQIWGGECFAYHYGRFSRVAHLAYFPMLMGDKMSREPRLSALSLSYHLPQAASILKEKFNSTEWTIYKSMMRMPAAVVNTSSMGRLLDGIASLIGIIDISTYEGEAAMLLQAAAETAIGNEARVYDMPVTDGIIHWQPMIESILDDLHHHIPAATIAFSVHQSLANLVLQLAHISNINDIACSGGVMQNALLVDLIKEKLQKEHTLFLHQQLSPNDECISFGQLAWYHAKQIIVHTKLAEQTKAAPTSERYSAIDK